MIYSRSIKTQSPDNENNHKDFSNSRSFNVSLDSEESSFDSSISQFDGRNETQDILNDYNHDTNNQVSSFLRSFCVKTLQGFLLRIRWLFISTFFWNKMMIFDNGGYVFVAGCGGDGAFLASD